MPPAPPVSHDPLVSEIRMLLDYITGSPVQTLRDLVIPDPEHPPVGDAPPTMLRNAAVLNRLNDLEAKIACGTPPLTSNERTFLQLLRDALGLLVRPATGLTIAYTSMVVARQRGPYSQSRAARAEQAYPSLAAPAWRHRWAQRILLCLAVLITGFAVWQSAHVALGRSLLQSVQSLQSQQAAISLEMTKLLEASRPPVPATPVSMGGIPFPATPVMRLCDRPRAFAAALHGPAGEPGGVTLFESPAQQSICDRDLILAAKFAIAHEGLLTYMSDWTSVIRPGKDLSPRLAVVQRASQTDVDFAIGPVLLILGNYVLPIVFALLGATVYVILDFYSKVRDSILAPRDSILSWIRLVLGMVLGACVGLFFSTANPAASPAGAALAESITLSASGLAFIAGFGVEGVFGMLDSLVRRVFSGDQDKGARLAPG